MGNIAVNNLIPRGIKSGGGYSKHSLRSSSAKGKRVVEVKPEELKVINNKTVELLDKAMESSPLSKKQLGDLIDLLQNHKVNGEKQMNAGFTSIFGIIGSGVTFMGSLVIGFPAVALASLPVGMGFIVYMAASEEWFNAKGKKSQANIDQTIETLNKEFENEGGLVKVAKAFEQKPEIVINHLKKLHAKMK